MKRLSLLITALLLLAATSHAQKIHGWTAIIGEQMYELTLAERSDGLMAGTLAIMSDDGSGEEQFVAGHMIEDGVFIVVSYRHCFTANLFAGEIGSDGKLACHFEPEKGDSMEVVMIPTPGKTGFIDPFIHATYKDLALISEYANDFASMVVKTDGKGDILFRMDAEKSGRMFGALYYDEEPEDPSCYLSFNDGIVEYEQNSVSLRIEFFKDFAVVERTSEYDPNNSAHVDSDYVLGVYRHQASYDDYPVWWFEDEESDFDEFGAAGAGIDEIVMQIRSESNDFQTTGEIDIDLDEKRPNIEDYFDAFLLKYHADIAVKTYFLAKGYETNPGATVVWDKPHGYISSHLGTGYNDGMQMCYWKGKEGRDVVAVVLYFDGLSLYDVYEDMLFVLYEYDTEKRQLIPVSAAGHATWAADEAHRLPEEISNYSRIVLPREGKDIVYYKNSIDGEQAYTLHWTGTWFK